MSDKWFAMNGVKVPALRVTPIIVEPGLDVYGDEMVARLGRWRLKTDIDKADVWEYRALVDSMAIMDLVFLDDHGAVRRGTAYLMSVFEVPNSTVLQLEWRGHGRLR